MSESSIISSKPSKEVGSKEFIIFLIAAFFYTMITGMVGSYRQEYLTYVFTDADASSKIALINTIVNIANYFVSFLTALIIDRSNTKKGKFRPIITLSAIPLGILLLLNFYIPDFLKGQAPLMVTYFCITFIVYGAIAGFGNSINMVAVVMSTNNKERDNVLNWRGIVTAVGSAAPMLIILIISSLLNPTEQNEITRMYLISAVICSVFGTITMLLGAKVIKERTVYSDKRENPLKSFKTILSSRNAIVVLISEFLKNFRCIATYMMGFLAIVYFGKPGQTLLFGICTGVGTFSGMFIIKALLNKFSNRTLYIASGIYSIFANIATFGIGYLSFTNPDNVFLKVLFFIFLYLIGLQFGASNLLPSLFGADILEELELKSGKRYDASYTWVVGLGSAISGIIANAVAPTLLLGENTLIGYIPWVEGVTYSLRTKLMMLAFYTIFHGICLLMAGLPFIFYTLTGDTKKHIHEQVLANRAALANDGTSIHTTTTDESDFDQSTIDGSPIAGSDIDDTDIDDSKF